ncbi:MAG: class I SAM-dependent methyltransferase [Mycobacterium sp.]
MTDSAITGQEQSFSWAGWHQGYADPDSDLSRRLVHVQRRLSEGLDAVPAGPIRLISLCAGEGRDVLGVLPDHPRRDDVTARLVELDPDVAATARSSTAALGLDRVEVVTGDAGTAAAYAGLAPADVVLACGIFGNVVDDDIRRTIRGLAQLCKPGATVLWTRHRGAPDLTPQIRTWFGEADFDEVGFDYEDGRNFAVGTQRFRGVTARLDPSARFFEFAPRDRP